MELKHVMNEQLKRLEPTDTGCYYCGQANATNARCHYYIPVFKEQDRTNVIVYRSVKYQKVEIGIPRCESCMDIHDNASSNAVLYALLAALVVVITGFCIWGIFGIFGIFIGIFVAFGSHYFIQKWLVERRGILTKKDGAKRNATVQQFIINGWSFNQPAA